MGGGDLLLLLLTLLLLLLSTAIVIALLPVGPHLLVTLYTFSLYTGSAADFSVLSTLIALYK